VARASVSEAIDLHSQPSLGPAWNASDGQVAGDNLVVGQFITPCGVLVDVFKSMDQGGNQGARMVGYEISTGNKAWSVPLSRATGLAYPKLTYPDPTYTPDCKMVLTFDDVDMYSSTRVGVMVDLSSGETTVLGFSDQLELCTAASTMIACQYQHEIVILDGADTSVEQRSIPTFGYTLSGYAGNGDVVVDGMVSSAKGYQDPATGDVVFGADVRTGQPQTDDSWVVYKEPYGVDHFLSGRAIRLEGPLSAETGTCFLMAWDTTSDQGLWDTPASIPCGDRTSGLTRWAIAGSVLVVHNDWLEQGDQRATQAFSWEDGSLLWQSGTTLGRTGWNQVNDNTNCVQGLTADYMIFQKTASDRDILRLTDGFEVFVAAPKTPLLALTEKTAYLQIYAADKDSQSALSPFLARLLINGNDDPLWQVRLPDDASNVWTFAVDETMYVVYTDSSKQIWVSQLVE